jgi:hypothetical protein
MALTESLRDRWADFPSLDATVALEHAVIEGGSIGRGRVELRNHGATPIEFHTDRPFVAKVLDPTTMASVAGAPGWILGTGLLVRLGSGDVTSVPFIFATTTSKDGEAVALAPSDYLVKADVPIYEVRPDGEGSERSFLSMEVIALRIATP